MFLYECSDQVGWQGRGLVEEFQDVGKGIRGLSTMMVSECLATMNDEALLMPDQ